MKRTTQSLIFSLVFCLTFLLLSQVAYCQSRTIVGQLTDADNVSLPFANVILYDSIDSSIVKVEVTDDEGSFTFTKVEVGVYQIKVTYVSLADKWIENVTVQEGVIQELGTIKLQPSSVQLETATVTAKRALVEVKADRTVFNVHGTINSTGNNSVSLLRKAPGIILDNNQNITILGRAGVLVCVDGTRIPYEGQELTSYLLNISADQIDRIDIITNPGAKYEAEGNAGIIDIILKRNTTLGTNGAVNSSYTIARKKRYLITTNLNHLNKTLNAFGSVSYGDQGQSLLMTWDRSLNGFRTQEETNEFFRRPQLTVKLGSDFYLGEHHTVGFVVNGAISDGTEDATNSTNISQLLTPDLIESNLQTTNDATNDRDDLSINLNYRYTKDKVSINVDGDYGSYSLGRDLLQLNIYYAGESTATLLSQTIQDIQTLTDISIMSLKLDIETEAAGGMLGFGGKIGNVASSNTFLFSDVVDDKEILNNQRSNGFVYDEQVAAAYLSYTRPLSDKLNLNSGLRLEQTDSRGDLTPFDTSLAEDPVDQNYWNWFPNLSLAYQLSTQHAMSLSYGRRINRPDYNVLNPFRNQLTELTFDKGNPLLKPEIVNNVQLSYTLKQRYNFSLSYSRTADKITRLIAPDAIDPKASFFNYDNLNTQTVISANANLPIDLSDVWTLLLHGGIWQTDNQATYVNDTSIDLQVISWYGQAETTYNFSKSLSCEVTGWVSGPGVWGGVFLYETQYALNVGVQKKLLNDRLIINLSVQDIFKTAGWKGRSDFNGLTSIGTGDWDSRRLALSLNYKFGNDQLQVFKRKTGIEEESERIGG